MKKQLKLSYFLVLLLTISSCKTIINENKSENGTDNNPPENLTKKKNQIEIRFSCGEDNISKYLDEGWNIIEEYSEEKICTWKSFPATKDCNMEEDKGCKITKPDKIGKEKIYLLEK